MFYSVIQSCFKHADLLGKLKSLPMQCTSSHWLPAHDRRHLGGGQYWYWCAFTV